MQQLYKLPLVLEPQPEGGYTITCPLIPELVTEADTVDQIAPHVADALRVVLGIYEDQGRLFPESLIVPDDGPPILADFLIQAAST